MKLFSTLDPPKEYIINGKKGQSFRYLTVKKTKNSLYPARPQILLKIIKTIKIFTTLNPRVNLCKCNNDTLIQNA